MLSQIYFWLLHLDNVVKYTIAAYKEVKCIKLEHLFLSNWLTLTAYVAASSTKISTYLRTTNILSIASIVFIIRLWPIEMFNFWSISHICTRTHFLFRYVAMVVDSISLSFRSPHFISVFEKVYKKFSRNVSVSIRFINKL